MGFYKDFDGEPTSGGTELGPLARDNLPANVTFLEGLLGRPQLQENMDVRVGLV